MGGGLWRSSLSTGPLWFYIGDNLPNPSVGAFIVNPFLPDDILVGSGDYNRYQGTGMFHTTDGGQMWSTIALPCTPTAFFRLHYLPGNLDVMLAATSCGLLRSEHGPGGPWTNTLTGVVTDLAIHPTDTSVQFCSKATTAGANDGGIYKSTDAGRSWTPVTSTLVPANNFGTARIAICRDQPTTMAFVCENGCNITNNLISGVFKSVDGGVTWTNITGSVVFGDNQSCHVLAIAFRPNNPQEIFVGANNIFRTTNGGVLWYGNNDTYGATNNTDKIKPHQDITQFYFSFLTGDNVMWQCSDGGIFTVDLDANTYESWNGTGAGSLSISTIVDMDGRGSVRGVGLQDDGAALSGNAGTDWKGYGCCDVYDVAVTDAADPAFWYMPRQKDAPGVVVKQFLSGTDQDAQDVGETTPVGQTNLVVFNRLLFDPFSSKVFSLVRETNRSLSLVSRPSSATSQGTWTREVTNLFTAISGIAGNPLNGQSLYLWDNSFGVLTVLNKPGSTWSVARTPTIGGAIGTNNYQISTVASSPDTAGEGWAGLVTRQGNPRGNIILGGQAKVLHTADDWQTWTELSPLPAGQVTGIAITRLNALNTRKIFVSTDVGVFYSRDHGASWQPFQTGLPRSVYCTGIRYVESSQSPVPGYENEIVVATCGRGMYERTVPGIIYVDQRNNSGTENGTREHPFNTLAEGVNATPEGGTMALNGASIYQSTGFTKPITITAYEFPAQLRP
jgi:photosystem II stability/assembly factor-like uncharacterized protein